MALQQPRSRPHAARAGCARLGTRRSPVLRYYLLPIAALTCVRDRLAPFHRRGRARDRRAAGRARTGHQRRIPARTAGGARRRHRRSDALRRVAGGTGAAGIGNVVAARGTGSPRDRRGVRGQLGLAIGNVAENLNRTDLGRGLTVRTDGARAPDRRTAGALRRRYMPSGCITAHGAVLRVSGSLHDQRSSPVRRRLRARVFTYSRRLFAGGHGQFIQGYQVSAAAQQQIIERLQRQFVLFALMLSDEERQWRAESVPVDAFIRANFSLMAEIPGTRTVPCAYWFGTEPMRSVPAPTTRRAGRVSGKRQAGLVERGRRI